MASVVIGLFPPDRLSVCFPYDAKVIPALKAIAGHRWNPARKVWTFPRSDAVLVELRRIFAGAPLEIDPVLVRGAALSRAGLSAVVSPVSADDPLLLLQRELRLRNYSTKTIKAYRSCVRSFIRYLDGGDPLAVQSPEIRRYLLHLMEDEHYASASVNQAINALRFLYLEVFRREFAFGDIPRPAKERQLPVVLSQEEVRRIFEAAGNLKHRMMLMLVYSAGLRVSEVVSLRPEDLDGDRRTIHLHRAKGHKDRYTILSEGVLSGLRGYWKEYKPREWLFEGQKPGRHYSVRSAEQVFTDAVEKAGIRKRVSIHSLRHAFATH